MKLIELEAAPKALNGRTLLPIRAVCEELGATVNWNGSENLIEISAKKTSKNTDKDFFDEFCDWANIRLLVDNVWHRPSFRKQNHGNTQLYDIFPKEFKYSWSLIYDCCVVENDTYFYENGTGRDSWGGRYDYDFDGKTLLLYNRDGTTTYTYDTQTGNFVAKGEIWLNLDGSKLGNEYLIPHKNMITPEQAVEMVKAYQDDVYCFRFWDSFDDEFYYIQHYEDMETHTATEGRYYVNKWTGEVICCL